MHPIRHIIEQACDQNNIKHTELCERAAISRETFYRILRGDVERATVATIYKIARAAKIAPIILLRLVYNDIDLGTGCLRPTKYDGDIPTLSMMKPFQMGL